MAEEAKWYVVHTYSGYENKVMTTLMQQIESRHLEDRICEIRVPTETVVETTEKGTKEYNINIVIAEQVKNISSVSFEKWYKANVSPSDGLWIGNGITEQYQMKANKTTSEMHEDITPEFGYSVIKGKCVKLKLLSNRAEEEEDDE